MSLKVMVFERGWMHFCYLFFHIDVGFYALTCFHLFLFVCGVDFDTGQLILEPSATLPIHPPGNKLSELSQTVRRRSLNI